jgi:hypothetical protein
MVIRNDRERQNKKESRSVKRRLRTESTLQEKQSATVQQKKRRERKAEADAEAEAETESRKQRDKQEGGVTTKVVVTEWADVRGLPDGEAEGACGDNDVGRWEG